MDILRFATAGSVDDGKSTLIGRLLYDSKAIFEDQLEAVERTSRDRGEDYTNLALLTDGLRAEREQGITIDVAYRYFATPRRKFIIADTPGHIQYTRNMVTGASTADLAVVLVDARNGLTEQSRRHAFLTTLLRVPHLVLAVNKMDLVDYRADVFERICEEFSAFAAKLEIGDLTFVPISALHGDNVVERSANMPWYDGPSLLHHLEHVHIASDRNLIDVRFPVQYVIRPQAATDPALHDYRGYAGQVAGGVLKPGDEVMHLPSGFTTRIRGVETAGTPVAEAFPPMSVTLLLDDDVDISRGDMICRPNNRPAVAQDIEAMVCWMSSDQVAGPAQQAGRQAHLAHGEGHRHRPALPDRREHPAPRRSRDPAQPERGRPGPAPADPADLLRSVRPEPDDRRPDPHRRGHQRHGRRRHDHRRPLARLGSRQASGRQRIVMGMVRIAAYRRCEVTVSAESPAEGSRTTTPFHDLARLRGDPAGDRAAAGAGRQLAGGGGADAEPGPEEVPDQHLADRHRGRAGAPADPVRRGRGQPAVPARRLAAVHLQAARSRRRPGPAGRRRDGRRRRCGCCPPAAARPGSWPPCPAGSRPPRWPGTPARRAELAGAARRPDAGTAPRTTPSCARSAATPG